MTSFRRFGTFYIVTGATVARVTGVGVPRVWRVTTASDPSRRHWCNKNGSMVVTLDRSPSAPSPITRGLALARQIVIEARSQEVADRVSGLIRAGTLARYPDLLKYPTVSGTYAVDEMRRDFLTRDPFHHQFHVYDDADVGVAAAARAWTDRSLIYALEKFRFSVERDWFTPHSADPIHRQIFPNRYREESYHVTAAFAIVAAYSVIEELGLEPRSSSKQPRFLNGSKGPWNPKVLQDLEQRLRDAGLNPDDTWHWIRRGTPTKVEREMRPKLGTFCNWSKPPEIRDRDLRLADAIHYCSWLRNFVAAHRFRALTEFVSPYEVHNAQGIARRLLLGKLGLWRAFLS